MRGRKALTFVLVASLMMVGATGTVLADAEVGASGNCDDADGNNGGGAAVLVSEDDQDLLTPEEIVGTVMGLAHLAQASDPGNQSVSCEEGETSTDDEDQGNDYLEAHADNGQDQAVQVCVDEETTTGNGEPVLADGDDGQFEGTDHDDTNDNRNCEYGQHQNETQSPESPV